MESVRNTFSNIKWYHITIFILAILVICILIMNSFGNNNNGVLCKNAPNNELFTSNPDTTNPPVVAEPIRVQDKYDAEIVLYYATWCGYSRMILPEWDKFATYAAGNFPNVMVTKQRCEDGNEAVCMQKGIEGYPTIVLYPKNNTEITYKGERKAEKIIDFVKSNL